MRDKKNVETRCEMKKKWRDKTQDKKNGEKTRNKKNREMRRKTKKIERQDARQRKIGR